MKTPNELAAGVRMLWIHRVPLLLPLLAFVLVGCAATPVHFWPSESAYMRHAPKDPSQILVVQHGSPIVPYRIVGSMDLSAGGADLGWFTDRFRQKAAEVGADGIMNLRVVRTGVSEVGTSVGRPRVGETTTSVVEQSATIQEMTADAFVLTR